MKLKRIYVARRNPAVAEADFPARWAQHHRLGQRFPELVHHYPRSRYCLVQHGSGIDGLSEAHDAVGMLWLRGPDSLGMVVRDETAIPTMRADERLTFAAPVFDAALAVEETVLQPGASDGVCLLTLPRRRAGTASFDGAWTAALQRLAPQAGRIVVAAPLQPPSFPADLVGEIWFDGLEQARTACASAAFQDLLALEDELAEPGCTRLLTRVCYAWEAG